MTDYIMRAGTVSSDDMSRAVAEFSQAQASRGCAKENLDALVQRYDGNFDILNDGDAAIDMFIDAYLATLDDSIIFSTPPQLVVMPGAGSVTRFEDDVYYIGVDEDHAVYGDVLPVTLDFDSFFQSVDKAIVSGRLRNIEVPPIEIVLSNATRESSSRHVSVIATNFNQKNCVFVDPPFALRNSLNLQSIKFQLSTDIAAGQVKCLRNQNLVFFGLTDAEMAEYIGEGYRVINILLNPYYPQSVRYVKELNLSPAFTDAKFFFGRKVVKVKYETDTRYNTYTPVYWACYFGIHLSELFREWVCSEIRTNIKLDCNPPRSTYFNFLVDVRSVLTNTQSVLNLGVGDYNSRSLDGVIQVRPGLHVRKLDLVGMTTLSMNLMCVTARVPGPRGELRTFRIKDGYPIVNRFYMFRGEFYETCNFRQATKSFRLLVNHRILTEMSNVRYSLVNFVLGVDVTTLNYVFNTRGEMMYKQMIMLNPVMTNYVECDVQTDHRVVDLEVEPLLY